MKDFIETYKMHRPNSSSNTSLCSRGTLTFAPFLIDTRCQGVGVGWWRGGGAPCVTSELLSAHVGGPRVPPTVKCRWLLGGPRPGKHGQNTAWIYGPGAALPGPPRPSPPPRPPPAHRARPGPTPRRLRCHHLWCVCLVKPLIATWPVCHQTYPVLRPIKAPHLPLVGASQVRPHRHYISTLAPDDQ